jgi:membrane protein required for colicin V production
LAPVDRVLGAGFGLVRGVAIVLTGVLLAGMTTLPKQPMWRQALLAAPLEDWALAVKGWLPGDFARHIRYDR